MTNASFTEANAFDVRYAPTGVDFIVTTSGTSAKKHFVVQNYSSDTVAGDYFEVSNACLFDLTVLFGAGNEPTTVEDFKAMFPASYYPYALPLGNLAELSYTVVSTW